MSTIAGIDLGTSTFVVSAPDASGNPVVLPNDLGELFTASAVYFESPGKYLFGTEAKHLGLLNPSRCVENSKRFLGTQTVLYTDEKNKEYRAEDIAALLLGASKKLYEQARGEILSEVAVTVPANFTDEQKRLVIEAAKSVGLDVLLTCHEPTAAVFGNGLHKRGDHRAVLLDLGGGTFDVSVCEVRGNNVEILATGGEPQLGGTDFNARLTEHVLSAFEKEHKTRPTLKSHPIEMQELAGRVEQLKISLSARDSASVLLVVDGKALHLTITRTEFANLTRDLLDRAMDRAALTLKEAKVTVDQLESIVPVGGASKMPVFLSAIEKKFGRKATSHADPFFAVALGALVVGRVKKERDGSSTTYCGRRLPPLDIFLRDRTAHAIGVCVLDDDQKSVNAVILDKGCLIPSDHTKPFQLSKPGQTSCLIQLLQGADGAYAEDCEELGRFELDNLKPIHHEPHRIEIRIRIDDSGRLMAEAVDPHSGVRKDLDVPYQSAGKKAA